MGNEDFEDEVFEVELEDGDTEDDTFIMCDCGEGEECWICEDQDE